MRCCRTAGAGVSAVGDGGDRLSDKSLNTERYPGH